LETAALPAANRVGMISADKQQLLNGFLCKLPEPVASRLAKAVEVDRLIGGQGLPHEVILDALRPRLRQAAQHTRMPTPQRFFCQPFEDLLIARQRNAKQKGRIARSSIEPVWNWLANELMPARHHELTDAIRDAILYNRLSDVEQRAAELWDESAAALTPALADEKKMTAAARKLGGVVVAEDAAEIALLLCGAREIEKLQNRLSKPIVSLTDEDIAFLRDAYDKLTASNPNLAPYVPLVVLGRLERPWEVLRVAAALTRKSTDTLISATDLAVVGDLLFSDLDVYVKKIQAARAVDFESEAVLRDLASFAELASGMVKELGFRRDGKWGQSLAKDRAAVAGVMEGLLEKAPREILAALPLSKVSVSGKGSRPLDLSRPHDPERTTNAKRYAHLMVHSRPFAAAVAFNARLIQAFDETASALRTHGDEMVRELRAAPSEMRANLDVHFVPMLELCTLVLGGEEAALIRRRARMTAAA
jgi:hypothetical protein